MENGIIILNIGFILNFIALAFREILWIRILLTAGYLLRYFYQMLYNEGSIGTASESWMLIFVSVNMFQIVRIINERRKRYIEPKIVDLYKTIFKDFSSYEFLNFWKMGKMVNVNDGELIIGDGDYSNSIRLILDGEVKIVNKKGKNLTYLSRGHFIGEISYISRKPAIADVVSNGPVSFIEWNNKKLNDIKETNNNFWIKIQNIILHDMIGKIKRSND